MAKDPAERYQSAAEMLRDLAQGSASAMSITVPRARPQPARRRRRRRRRTHRRHPAGTGRGKPAAKTARCRTGSRAWRTPRHRPAASRPGRAGRARLAGGARRRLVRTARGPARGAERRVRPRARPGLWIAPDWEQIARASQRPRSSIATPRSAPRGRPGGRLARRPRPFPQRPRVGLASLHPARPGPLPPPRRRPAPGLRRRARPWNATQDAREGAGRRSSRPRAEALDGDAEEASTIVELEQAPPRPRLIDPALAELAPGDRSLQAERTASRTGTCSRIPQGLQDLKDPADQAEHARDPRSPRRR